MSMKAVKKPVAEQLLRDHPGIATRTAARMLCAKYPKMFPDIDTARTHIRRIRGTTGCDESHNCAVEDLALEWSKCRAVMPTPITYDFTPRQFSSDVKRILIMADAQIPFHAPVAIEAAIDKGVEEEVDGVLILGDWWDCQEYSHFERDGRMRDMTAEALAVRQSIAMVRSNFPDAQIIYKVGNHEERMGTAFERNLLGLIKLLEHTGRKERSVASVGGVLELKDFDIEMIEDRRPVLIGKYLWCLHGHEGGGAYVPVSPARTIALRARACCLVAHHHKTSSYVERGIDGREIATHSIGALCDLTPKWMPLNSWNWGFAVAEVLDDGGFRLHNYRVSHKGEIWS